MKKRILRAASMTLALSLLVGIWCSGNRFSAIKVSAAEETAPEETEEVSAEDESVGFADSVDIASQVHYVAKPRVVRQAQQVSLRLTDQSRKGDFSVVLDDKDRSFAVAWSSVKLSFAADSPFTRLYIKVERACEWTVTLPDGTEIECGKTGFIHEVTELGQAVTSFDMNLPKGVRLCDVYAFTDGQFPSWVQLWEPPCEKADLLVMPTHADDEYLWFGGTLPYYAGELGYQVQVVYLTNHYNNTQRCHEQLNSLWTVGVRHYPVIGDFVDVLETRDDMSAAYRIFGGRDKVLAFQVEVLRRFSPKVIVAHAVDGEYGHCAHRINVATMRKALTMTNDATAYPESAEKYGTCEVQKCYMHLWKKNKVTVSWGDMPLKRFDDATALDMAKKGFECNISQLDYVLRVHDYGPYDCRQFGLVYTTVGNDTEGVNDFFENVV